MSKAPVILVDGSSYLFRAYHALPPLTNSKGHPTGAIYGVTNMLKKLIIKYKPEYMAVVFDTKSKNFRHEIFPDYKANRDEMPDELAVQISPLHKIIEALGIKLIKKEGYEADDIIGTVAKELERNGQSVLISTGDKDFAQLVTDKVTLINTMNDKLMDVNGVKEKFGVEPDKILDYLALIGDTSDNIPGVPKVGPKTAVKLIDEYGDIENIIDNASKIKGKVGENILNNIEQLRLSYKLVTIVCDFNKELELDLSSEELRLKDESIDSLKELYREYNFKAWLKDLDVKENETSTVDSNNSSGSNRNADAKYYAITNKQELKSLIKNIKENKSFVIDLETTSLDYIEARIVGFALCVKDSEAYYIPVAHNNVENQLDCEYVLDELKVIFEDTSIIKIGHNLKYDINVLAKYKVTLNNIEDTMLLSYVYNSTATRHNMDALASYYLDYETISYEEVAGKGVKQKCFSEVNLEQALDYAAEDALITLRLYNYFLEHYPNNDLLKVYSDIEKPLVKVLSEMELTGVTVDVKELDKQSKSLAIKLQKLENEIYSIAGEEFNISSPKQLQSILFEKLKLPILKKTSTGQASTAEPVLQELSLNFTLPKLVLEYRSLAKLKSTYTDKLPLQVKQETNRVHTSYHQAIAATGRLSSTDPNLQNIPIKTAEGRKVRDAFIPREGYKLVSADYSQIELRIMAHLSADQDLIKAFNNDLDIHNFTASQIFSCPIEKVSREQRRSAKAINFGLIYGMSAYGLSQQLNVDQSTAQEYINEYFARYPAVKQFMSDIKEKAEKQGYVETIYNRRLYLPEINSKNGIRKKAAQRAAINAPMQGSNADIIKIAMQQIYSWVHEENKNGEKIKLLMQVHDELVFEVKNSFVKTASEKIKEIMENVAKLSIPLLVEVNSGENWNEAH